MNDEVSRQSALNFMPGLALSRTFFQEVVEPAVRFAFPHLQYAAGLFGPGSDVLGYDSERSMDHDWGPRCILVIDAEDEQAVGASLRGKISAALPSTFRGFPVLFHDSPGEPGVLVPADLLRDAPLRHRVEVTTFDGIGEKYGYAPGDEDDPAFWLTVTDQRLLELTAGDVFRDDLGELTRLRSCLAFYPDAIWRYRMATMWMRISQIEPFVGRTGEVGDEIGSWVISARLIEDIMRLALLQARQYAPYSKWLGSAFSRLAISGVLLPHLIAAREATSWRGREAGINTATAILVNAHNALGITEEIDATPRPFHSRPFMVIEAERVARSLSETLVNTPLHLLTMGVGGIDQFIDSTDALNSRWLRQSLRGAITLQIEETIQG
ncbi:MAG TPA: DUF4037 domain-containing protein [Thermomicrobiales bacterium]|nr:DUF4037 domain-containing protein [Thermomicrobiales bacterium]